MLKGPSIWHQASTFTEHRHWLSRAFRSKLFGCLSLTSTFIKVSVNDACQSPWTQLENAKLVSHEPTSLTWTTFSIKPLIKSIPKTTRPSNWTGSLVIANTLLPHLKPHWGQSGGLWVAQSLAIVGSHSYTSSELSTKHNSSQSKFLFKTQFQHWSKIVPRVFPYY